MGNGTIQTHLAVFVDQQIETQSAARAAKMTLISNSRCATKDIDDSDGKSVRMSPWKISPPNKTGPRIAAIKFRKNAATVRAMITPRPGVVIPAFYKQAVSGFETLLEPHLNIRPLDQVDTIHKSHLAALARHYAQSFRFGPSSQPLPAPSPPLTGQAGVRKVHTSVTKFSGREPRVYRNENRILVTTSDN